DDVAAQVRARVNGRSKMSHLARVSGVTLLDAHRVEEPRPADLVAPDTLDPRHPHRLELRAKESRSEERAIEGLFVRRLVGRRAEHDRIVSVVDGLDLHDRLRARIAGVVA